MTLACKDGNSKLVEVVTVAQVDDEIRVVQIWKVKFDHHLSFCSDFKHKVSRFGQDFKLMFRQDFKAEVWSLFYC